MQVRTGHFQGHSNIYGAGNRSLPAVLNSKVDKEPLEDLVAIADPATASAEDCANKINEILAALQSTPTAV